MVQLTSESVAACRREAGLLLVHDPGVNLKVVVRIGVQSSYARQFQLELEHYFARPVARCDQYSQQSPANMGHLITVATYARLIMRPINANVPQLVRRRHYTRMLSMNIFLWHRQFSKSMGSRFPGMQYRWCKKSLLTSCREIWKEYSKAYASPKIAVLLCVLAQSSRSRRFVPM